MSTQKKSKIETIDQTEAAPRTEAPFEAVGAAPQPEPTNPFDDMESLRVNQDFVAQAGVKKLLTTVPVRKPNKQSFVQVRREPEFRRNFACIELRDEQEIYIVATTLQAYLPGEVTLRTFYTVMSRQGVLSLWPVKFPNPDGRRNEWAISERVAAEMAMKRWIRVVPNMALGAYEVFAAEGDLPAPEWPSYSFEEICNVAFRDRPIIRSFDHPVIRRLRGLA